MNIACIAQITLTADLGWEPMESAALAFVSCMLGTPTCQWRGDIHIGHFKLGRKTGVQFITIAAKTNKKKVSGGILKTAAHGVSSGYREIRGL